MRKYRSGPATLWPLILIGLAGFLSGQQSPLIQEEVVVRWWLVPVYAVNQDDSPILNLKADDFEVYVDGKKLGYFDLHKKEFQAVDAPIKTIFGKESLPFQKKMVFLIFDAAFSPYNLLQRAKRIAETMMSQEGEAAQYLVMSIEPYAGLNFVCGPTRDRDLVVKDIAKYVSGKKADYLRANVADSSDIRNPYPEGDRRNPDAVMLPSMPGRSEFERLDRAEKKRTAASYLQALTTLNLILGYYRDNSKVLYLFSCGIPMEALEEKTEVRYDGLSEGFRPEVGVGLYENITLDSIDLVAVRAIGNNFNRNGSLLFLVNPAGTRVPENDGNSGEMSLRLLASQSGGRYFEGTEEDIAQDVASLESAYYEISFPDSDDFEGPDMDLEIRPKESDVKIYTVKRVSRGKEYRRLTKFEKEVLVLSILNQGPDSQVQLKAEAIAPPVSEDGGQIIFSVPLPPGQDKSEWEIFKVWRNPASGRIRMESDRLTIENSNLQVEMEKRTGFLHDMVLVHPQTSTALICSKR